MKRKAGDCKDRIKAYRSTYDDMCKNVKGLEPRLNRMKSYKGIDISGKSGIIRVGSEEMYRKSKGEQIEPMPKKLLQKIEKGFKRQGGVISRGKEIDEYLSGKNAEAITYDQHTILLKSHPGRASVFEELIHATQYKNGENDGSYLKRLQCEISAQEKLIANSKYYKLTKKELKQTELALESYKKELSEYLKGGH